MAIAIIALLMVILMPALNRAKKQARSAACQVNLHQQTATLDGQMGALLHVVSAPDGKKLAEYKLETVPVFDGMAAANGRLYLSMKNGRVQCFEGK